jgi:hypothetical protein
METTTNIEQDLVVFFALRKICRRAQRQAAATRAENLPPQNARCATLSTTSSLHTT